MDQEDKITKSRYKDIFKAREALCGYCENDECENCIVTLLCDQAHQKAVDAGITEDD